MFDDDTAGSGAAATGSETGAATEAATGSAQDTSQGVKDQQGVKSPADSGASILSGKAQATDSTVSQGDSKGATSTAPEQYTLQVPEGVYTPEQIAVAEKQFRELGLDNAAAQKLMDTSVAAQQQAQEQHKAQVQRWAEEVRMDKEMGGPAFDATVAEAKSALTLFDSDGAVFGMLEQTGYANNPAVIRFLSRIGKKLGEDTLVNGKTTPQDKPLWDRLYPTEKQ